MTGGPPGPIILFRITFVGKAPVAKKAKGTSKQALPAQTSKHFSHKADYQRLVFVLQNSKSNKEAAEKIGVSERTIRRWKTFGVPN